MILSVQSTHEGADRHSHEINLDELVADELATSADSLDALIVIEVAKLAIELGCGFDDIYPSYVSDDNGNELDAAPSGNPDWTKEVARLTWLVGGRLPEIDSDQVFALIGAVGWRYVDFDNLQHEVEDGYYGEWDGDYEDFGRNRVDELHEDIPYRLKAHFDYEQFGRDELDGYDSHEWNGRTFLYY